MAAADDEQEVAWLAMPEKAPVMGEAGEEIGRAEGGGAGGANSEDYDPAGLHRPGSGRARAASRVQVALEPPAGPQSATSGLAAARRGKLVRPFVALTI